MRWKGWLARAATASVVDATRLAGVGRYSSHMSGTPTHSMVGGIGGDLRLLVLGLLAIPCFLLGAVLAGIVPSIACLQHGGDAVRHDRR